MERLGARPNREAWLSEHEHFFWHYYLCEDEDGMHKVWDDAFYPVPQHSGEGYECMICGAIPETRGMAP
jgi:hypothetical protein